MFPLVSVIMTCYNRETLIAESIQSVLNSDFSDFEFIIVDDNSSDNSVQVIKEFAAKDSRIKYFINRQNLGDYPNRNYAASLATGKYLKYVDSDDLIKPECLGEMLAAMELYPDTSLGICVKNSAVINPVKVSSKESYEMHFFKFPLFNSGPLHYIIRRDAFEKNGGFENERMISDSDLWYKLALQYSVVLFRPDLVWQRLHEKQELSDQKYFIVRAAKIKWKYLLNEKCELSRGQIKLIRENRIKRYLGFFLSSIKRLDFFSAGCYFRCFTFCLKLKV
ncbi:MAG: glycosyltransferase family 2 protein [Bacteroidetes bacterium]|nr:glycosyltransferase family 2 protein [Bacteroidota bacterium]